MGDNTEAKRGVLRRAGGYVRSRPTSQKVGAGAAAALLATAPFGGLSEVDEAGPGVIRLDQPIQVGPYRVIIDKVVELPDLDPAVPPKEGHKVLVFDAKVRNTSDRPDYGVTLTRQMHLTGGGRIDVETTPSLYSVDDTTRVSVINPGVEYRLAITYVTGGRWQGKTANLAIDRLEFVEEDSLGLDNNAWKVRDGAEWQGSLPLERKS